MLLTATLVAPLPAMLAHVRSGGVLCTRLLVVGVTGRVCVLTRRFVYNESQLQQLGTCALKVFTKNIANDDTYASNLTIIRHA